MADVFGDGAFGRFRMVPFLSGEMNDLSKKLLSQEVNREKPIIVEREGDALKFRN